MNKKIPVILDVDTGIDDAVAIVMALNNKKLDVKLIVTCHGNAPIESITDNTLDILATIGRGNVPVAQGLADALVKNRDRVVAHGADGLGEYEIDSGLQPLGVSALEATHKLLSESAQPITYLCIAPVTNLAKLIQTYPQDVNKIKQAVIMCGSNVPLKQGEIPYKEFNASVDPEACQVVLESSLKKVIITMEMGHTAVLDWQDVYKTKITNEFGAILEKIYRKYKDFHVKNGIATHDGAAVAYVIDSEMFDCVPAHMEVQYFKQLDSGVALVDYKKTPNVIVTKNINVKKFKKLYFDSIKKCKVNKNVVKI